MKKISLIFYLSLLSLGEIMAQACIPDITFTGTHTTTYTKSLTWIKSSGVTIIPTAADVTWDANPLAGVNGYVELNPGFETMPNSEFLAIVQAICVDAPLPIKLISFNAKAQESQVQLNWQTSSEINSAGFEIERSENGKEFNRIGYVKTEANNGKSVEKLSYEFTDSEIRNHNSEMLYYRLKQLDLDGKFEYSPIKFVKMEEKETINIYPNPTSDFVNIDAFGHQIKSIELLNTTGTVIYKENKVIDKIDLSGKPTGIYFLKIENLNGKIVVKKVMKN